MSPNILFSKDFIINKLGILPVEKRGQNFLIDSAVAQAVAGQTIRGARVLEIGAGPGTLTKLIAESGASEVVAIEVDSQFIDAQETVLRGATNVKTLHQDAMSFNIPRWADAKDDVNQVMGNIPYHLSQPVLERVVREGKRIANTTLLVGREFADAVTNNNPRSDKYTKTSFLASVMEVEVVAKVPKESFFPAPPVESAVVSMTYKEFPTGAESERSFAVRQALVASNGTSLTVAKVLNTCARASATSGKQLDKHLANRYDRREVRKELDDMAQDLNSMPIAARYQKNDNDGAGRVATSPLAKRMGLSQDILSKPLSSLNNDEVRKVASALDRV